MKQRERLAEATAPDGTVLTLWWHDGAYAIHAGTAELMSTRRFHSEEQLAEVACGPLQAVSHARVLIGGLGLGFTLRAALRVLATDARVMVVEIVPEIIAWNRHPDYALGRDALEDPRVETVQDDVTNVLRTNPGAYDAILLDVDNGAEALTTAGNAVLYSARGVRMTVRALRPAGRVAYWSTDRNPRFAAVLRAAGLSVETLEARAHTTSGGPHTLLVGQA
ncbi:MAG: spermidine synthase [Gemmatimonadota bacterium]